MKILVALDGSRDSESVLPLAGLLAGRWGAEILALRVMDPMIGGEPLVVTVSESVYQRRIDESQEYLSDLLVRHPHLPMRTLFEVGSPGFCIQETARQEECNLLMMATHCRSGLIRWLMGSVAEGVARRSFCPTMLLRSPKIPDSLRNILIPTDGSEPSLEVARHLGLFCSPETRVTLLHCAASKSAEPSEKSVLQERLRQQVEGRPWLQLEYSRTPAPQGIIEWLAGRDCDLIAMSTHGRDGLAHLWMGSTMEEVARQADCPVLVFPPGTLKPASAEKATR